MWPAVYSRYPKYLRESSAHSRDVGTSRLFYLFTEPLLTNIALTESTFILVIFLNSSYLLHNLDKLSLNAFVAA